MLSIRKFTVEHLPTGCVTDKKNPDFAFAVDSDRQGAKIQNAELSVNGWKTQTVQQYSIAYEGPALKPFTRYEASMLRTVSRRRVFLPFPWYSAKH